MEETQKTREGGISPSNSRPNVDKNTPEIQDSQKGFKNFLEEYDLDTNPATLSNSSI